jgi:lysophospholipase L1-like esterase
MTKRTTLFLVAAFSTANLLRGQTIEFRTYVSVGDSLASGFMSGSLVETHQARSVPALLARQAGVADFQQPLVTEPGIPPELTLVNLLPAAVIAPKAAASGAPKNLALARAYNNLAIPGATSVDALTRTTDAGGLHDLVLRGRGTQVAQAASLGPTFVTLWIGNNDVLGAAVRGRAIDGVTMTPAATFRTVYQGIVDALKATGARIVAANLPDVTTIPFVSTIPPIVVNPATRQPVLINGQVVPLMGPSGPLPSGSKVTLAAATLLAQGIGIPAALGGRATISGGVCSGCLPDDVVLDPGELTAIRDRVTADNQAISDICQAAQVPVLDINALLREFATSGRDIGGVTLTSAFLSGGIFSYDGIHPTELGYAVLANEWIKLINANGGSVPEVDLLPFLGLGVASRPAALTAGPVEFSAQAYEAVLRAFPRLDQR